VKIGPMVEKFEGGTHNTQHAELNKGTNPRICPNTRDSTEMSNQNCFSQVMLKTVHPDTRCMSWYQQHDPGVLYIASHNTEYWTKLF